MPAETYCVECGHFIYAYTRELCESKFWRHVRESHPFRSNHSTKRISMRRYRAHRLLQGDPRYWNALRNPKQLIAQA